MMKNKEESIDGEVRRTEIVVEAGVYDGETLYRICMGITVTRKGVQQIAQALLGAMQSADEHQSRN